VGTTFPRTKIEEVIQWLQERKNYLEAQGWSALELQFDNGYDDLYDINIHGTREETDKEYSVRMKDVTREKVQEQIRLQEHIKFVKQEAKRLGIIKA